MSNLSFKEYRKSLLPPILCERDRKLLKEILIEIESEIIQLGCPLVGPDDQRFWIYRFLWHLIDNFHFIFFYSFFSNAFNKLISNVTVYKDILADIKREYEDCITAIKNGLREASFLKSKLKTITSYPTTIASYKRRERELKEK